MRGNEFLDKMNLIDGDLVEQAGKQPARRKAQWVKWVAAAACLCIACAVAVTQLPKLGQDAELGGRAELGGKEIDTIGPMAPPIFDSLAAESIDDVKNTTVTNLSETEAYAVEKLGAYLPKELPDGYSFKYATLFGTVMKNDTERINIRITYGKETVLVPQGSGSSVIVQITPNGEENAEQPEHNTVVEPIAPTTPVTPEGPVAPSATPAPNDSEHQSTQAYVPMPGDEIVVYAMNFKPISKDPVLAPAELTEAKTSELQGRTFFIDYGDVYVGIFSQTAPASEIMSVINAIR